MEAHGGGSDWWTAIAALVALAALIRPDIARFLKNKTKSLILVTTDRIEIGFSGLGPNIGLVGAVVATGSRRVLVRMRAEITRERDSAKFQFDWLIFRPMSLSTSPEYFSQNAKNVHPIVIEEHKPESFNVFLNDRKAQNTLNEQALILQSEWSKYIEFMREQKQEGAGAPTPFTPEIFDLYEKWSKTSEAPMNMWKKIGDEFYWREGRYKIDICFQEFKGGWENAGRYNFQISPESNAKLIPLPTDQNPCAQLRRPMDMMRQG
jgi:hypothetical protein